ncbi:MAG: transglutaminase family protein [Proteobacteria bacterium]|nr:transglutaminase family protein [Pseudomonadota bacterium]
MSIVTALHHVTRYRYDRVVELGPQTIRLRPAAHARTPIRAYSLKISPAKHFINWQQDPFGNFLARVVFPDKVQEFAIEVDLIAEIRAFNPFDFFLEAYAQDFPFNYDPSLKEELGPYLEIKEDGPALRAWLDGVDRSRQSTIDFLVGINQRLNRDLNYNVRMDPGVQSCEDSLQLGSGSCRDMTWMLCQALRHCGLATRFASGYLIQLAADVKSLDGPSGTERDFTDLHAWAEVYLPGAGWVGLDATSGMFAGEGHIPLCCTPNPSSAAPVTGTLDGSAKATLEHHMQVQRIAEAPRVTKPYHDAAWADIDQLGVQIDRALATQDVRLTMGGEPTFVSLDDREHASWHFAALGGNKPALAKGLLARLQQRFAPGGVTMLTQGKWYPGEILPRWAMPCFWRTDGEPVWQAAELLADPDTPRELGPQTAARFLSAVAERLGIPGGYILPVHEDAPYYLWKEQKLPLHDEIMAADLFERAERERLQKLMDQNLNAPSGYALPLHFSHRRGRWISNRWQFKRAHAVALAGDSPLGLRLPLADLPWPKEAKQEIVPERSPFDAAGSLPTHAALVESLRARKVDDAAFVSDPNGLIRGALCTQVRGGVLYVFLPPIAWADHALELIAAIEVVAAAQQLPVVLEGYTPPADARLAHFSVTPDPGVIEVNIQPAAHWEDLKKITFGVYDDARAARLSTEKFLLDGRRVGTGGGNHIVMGALRPTDSPFLRRPDLLRSLISYWQNHPSLSYLFAGLYIGPTSQAPRIDEARHDSMYELELAFQQIPHRSKQDTAPWLIDRLFRNLLVDLTGNTHRAEFCIDKLYSPDSERGRLGLLEMRGFEMSPHPQMNLLQALLLRAFVANFWSQPYDGQLIRWGTRLHDQFMLPYFIQEDFRNVLVELRAAGYAFNEEWFAPFFAFRFPECGHAQIGDATLTVRAALEPWPVMGEEPAGSGVSRSVDVTVERLQITVTGLVEGRQVVTCNGRRMPLTPTRELGVQVAGVRFKAWSNPSSLNPQLPINAPLTFDVIDTAQERSLGGCVYHVAHPGGRNFETFPVNENEAEGRILARFETIGYTPGKIRIPTAEHNLDYPHTLDLRRKT